MADRARIGIPYDYNEDWIGGAYYVRNLIASFNLVEAERQPDIFLISNAQQTVDFIQSGARYPRLTWLTPDQVNRPVMETSVGRAARRVPFARRLMGASPKIRDAVMKLLRRSSGTPDRFDLMFPNGWDGYEDRTVCWIPDFQEKHFPDFFDEAELKRREEEHQLKFRSFRWIVFSSQSALSDFERFYPGQTIEPHIIHFAVFNDRVALDRAALKRRLGLPERFFYSPNQFWIHKNHATILDALGILRARGVKPFVAFSGREFDWRAPGHTEALKQRVIDDGFQDQVAFLGFLPRDEQLVLLEDATAIIQPSLSEGWSTVVEDAKSVSQYVIASDLAVHREQLTTNCAFFPPRDAAALADLIEAATKSAPVKAPFDYRDCQRAFANEMLALATKVVDARKPKARSPRAA